MFKKVKGKIIEFFLRVVVKSIIWLIIFVKDCMVKVLSFFGFLKKKTGL